MLNFKVCLGLYVISSFMDKFDAYSKDNLYLYKQRWI